jgi:GNAT superfamily N-acetyltransferase
MIEAAGYCKAKDLFAWIWQNRPLPPAVEAAAARLMKRNQITLRRLDRSRLAQEIMAFRQIYSLAWEDNWGFVPPTEREFEHMAKSVQQIADDRFALSASVRGEVVAFAVALPDINQVLPGTGGRLFPLGLYRLLTRKRRIDQVRLALLGVLPDSRGSGVFAALLVELFKSFQKAGHRRAEASWVLEDNDDVNAAAERLGAVRYKTYRIYEKPCA